MENTYITPEIYIDPNTGNWMINGVDTGVHAEGPKGEKGEAGEAGPAGPQGATGPQGAAGPQGLTGPMGPQGATGSQGLTGPTGPQGPQGVNGSQGLTGPTGPQGLTGAMGPTGLTGPMGPSGARGPAGPAPTVGDNGDWYVEGVDTGILADVDKAMTDRVVNSSNITAEGKLMDGKICSDKLRSMDAKLTNLDKELSEVVLYSSNGTPKLGEYSLYDDINNYSRIRIYWVNATYNYHFSWNEYTPGQLASPQNLSYATMAFISTTLFTIANDKLNITHQQRFECDGNKVDTTVYHNQTQIYKIVGFK